MQRSQQTTELPDSFEPLLRAAVDVSDVPPEALPAVGTLAEGAELASGRFRIVRLISRGGMGAVYEAEDHAAGARVALKVLTHFEPRAIKRFKDEFRVLADTIHPHLVRLHDLFVEAGTWSSPWTSSRAGHSRHTSRNSVPPAALRVSTRSAVYCPSSQTA